MNWFYQHKKIILTAGAAVIFIVILLNFPGAKKQEPVQQITASPETAGTRVQQQESKGDADGEKIIIDIKGAVKHPGVYELKTGDRVSQAIEKAGGINSEADEKQVNLAELLQDGTVVYIPSEGEEPTQSTTANASVQNGAGKEALVNINTASLEELQAISGVGPSKAEAIIAYREENGKFQAVEDITNVSGIGEKSFEKIKSAITVK
ncbi:helix-hairpin-helix domain-containing protein [Bacillus atrophaeus]|uniref:Membrane bound high-affinity DNA-binding receptor n=1 Tax=Bacillus atrophaeus (strain 1942) TaxID=720555 RepID=A0ABM5LZF7_BACA1|nr:helix-hairpin-helix domain-containing protein [Bacillus atrophaeus]AMR62076.1 competence protein ComE [Bacillus subtilis subsp. globigii]ADP33154.1 membrane bound high-affinity DNA-binding receptor [Bacillus atrophaeus 1942]AIK49233.1 comE operon protein 1 [Bacillus atrophaeus subsp. globigii]EIM12410.1 membrane bound high-affinity DNA-binding receptor [Bacillus atrophaeus C89]KFK81874.1 comE operon protein 1 [Bacillus atrophaeus]